MVIDCMMDLVDTWPSPAQRTAKVQRRWSSFPLLSLPGPCPRACSGDVPLKEVSVCLFPGCRGKGAVDDHFGGMRFVGTKVINVINADTRGLNERAMDARKTQPNFTDQGTHRLQARPAWVTYTRAHPNHDAVADVPGQQRERCTLSTPEQTSLHLEAHAKPAVRPTLSGQTVPRPGDPPARSSVSGALLENRTCSHEGEREMRSAIA